MWRLLYAALLATPCAAGVCPPFSEPVRGADADRQAGGCALCDCEGACYETSKLRHWPGDGACDTSQPNLACAAFEYDGGDCPQPPLQPGIILTQNTFVREAVALELE